MKQLITSSADSLSLAMYITGFNFNISFKMNIFDPSKTLLRVKLEGLFEVILSNLNRVLTF